MNNSLNDIFNFSNMSIEDLEAFLNQRKDEMKKKEILQNYKIKQLPPDKEGKAGRYWTKLNGKKVKKVRREDLEQMILDFHNESNKTFASVFDDFMKQRKKQRSGTTLATDNRYYNLYVKDSKWWKRPISSFTIQDGYEFYEHCQEIYQKNNGEPMKQKYWVNVKSFIDVFMRHCVSRGYIQQNPWIVLEIYEDDFTPATETDVEDRIFSTEEMLDVCDLARKDAYITNNAIPFGIPLLFNTGVREGELTAVRWSDIFEKNGQKYFWIRQTLVGDVTDDYIVRGRKIVPRAKTKRSKRQVPLNTECLAILDEIKALNISNGFGVEKDDLIFQRIYKKEISACTERCFTGRLTKYCKQAGMKVLKSPHDARRTAFTNMYLAGADIKTIQKIAGHETQKQTEEYIQIDALTVQNATEVLSVYREKHNNNNILKFPKNA